MVIYGAAAEQSVAKLFIGGFLPGILIGLLTAIYILYYAHCRKLAPAANFSVGGLLRATREGMWALGAPILILGSIYAGICTPTEAAGIACIYGIVVTRFVYKELTWGRLFEISIGSAFLTAQIMIIVAASGIFSWLLTISGVPQASVKLIEGLQLSPTTLLLLINLFLLLVGCLIDPTSATLVLTPLLMPMIKSAGIDPIHFGIILTVNLSIGMFTPPFGLNIFVSQALFKVPVREIVAGIVPFLAIQTTALAVITYVPALSLYLGRLIK